MNIGPKIPTMWTASLLWCCLLLCQTTLVLAQRNVTHCLDSTRPLVLASPFSPEERDDANFVSFTLVFYAVNESGVKQEGETLLLNLFDRQPELKSDRWKIYETWGLQMDNPRLSDTGRYESVIVRATEPKIETIYSNLAVAEPPVLKSAKLDVSRREDEETGVVTLSCGTLSTLGNPPAELIWRAPNGSALPGTYMNGNLSLTLTKEEAETPVKVRSSGDKSIKPGDGTFSCELREPSPAKECIAEADLPRWEGKFIFASTASSSEFGIILGVVIVCVIVVGLIVIIVLVVLIRKKTRGQAYNTKHEEAKADNNGQGPDASFPLMIQDDANPYDRPNAAAASPSNAYIKNPASPGHASPYMVSGLNLPPGQVEPPPKRQKAPVAATESGDSLGDGGKPAGRYIKRGKSKENLAGNGGGGGGAGGDNVDSRQPPTPKKRSIFLESNEALDKIAEAVRGGIGSGPDGGRAKESGV